MTPFGQLDPAMRVSDADREAVAESLARHVAAGRLTVDEHAERLDECFRARTAGELGAVLRELPAEPTARPAPVPGPGPGRAFGGPPLLPLVVLLVVASAVVHAPLFLLVLPIVAIVRRGRRGPWNGAGPAGRWGGGGGWERHPVRAEGPRSGS